MLNSVSVFFGWVMGIVRLNGFIDTIGGICQVRIIVKIQDGSMMDVIGDPNIMVTSSDSSVLYSMFGGFLIGIGNGMVDVVVVWTVQGKIFGNGSVLCTVILLDVMGFIVVGVGFMVINVNDSVVMFKGLLTFRLLSVLLAFVDGFMIGVTSQVTYDAVTFDFGGLLKVDSMGLVSVDIGGFGSVKVWVFLVSFLGLNLVDVEFMVV